MREQLLSRMIRIYGFEHEAVIGFARLVDDSKWSDSALECIVRCHELNPVVEEE